MINASTKYNISPTSTTDNIYISLAVDNKVLYFRSLFKYN